MFELDVSLLQGCCTDSKLKLLTGCTRGLNLFEVDSPRKDIKSCEDDSKVL